MLPGLLEGTWIMDSRGNNNACSMSIEGLSIRNNVGLGFLFCFCFRNYFDRNCRCRDRQVTSWSPSSLNCSLMCFRYNFSYQGLAFCGVKFIVRVWLLFRILIKDNLLRRTVVPLDDCYCIGGCGVVEDRNHLLVQCDVFSRLWNLVAARLGYDFVGHGFFHEQSQKGQFCALCNFSKGSSYDVCFLGFNSLDYLERT